MLITNVGDEVNSESKHQKEDQNSRLSYQCVSQDILYTRPGSGILPTIWILITNKAHKNAGNLFPKESQQQVTHCNVGVEERRWLQDARKKRVPDKTKALRGDNDNIGSVSERGDGRRGEPGLSAQANGADKRTTFQ